MVMVMLFSVIFILVHCYSCFTTTNSCAWGLHTRPVSTTVKAVGATASSFECLYIHTFMYVYNVL